MAKNNHKYRVSIYLGKENYETLQNYADTLMIPVTTLCRVIFTTGLEMSKVIEKGATTNGSK